MNVNEEEIFNLSPYDQAKTLINMELNKMVKVHATKSLLQPKEVSSDIHYFIVFHDKNGLKYNYGEYDTKEYF